MESFLLNLGAALGVQGIALYIVRVWIRDILQRLDRLNGFKDRFLAEYVQNADLVQHEQRCSEKFSDIFRRLHELEIKGD